MKSTDTLASLFEAFLSARKQIVDELRSCPNIIAGSNYSFEEGNNIVSLDDLFGDRKDLIVIHNMGRTCRYCTLWADGFNGILPHLESRTAVVLMNGDSSDVQREYSQSRSWNFRMISDSTSTFTQDMGFAAVEDGEKSLMPGFTTFYRDVDGTITRIASDFFGPGDSYMSLFPMFDLLLHGQAEWQPQYTYSKPLTITLPKSK